MIQDKNSAMNTVTKHMNREDLSHVTTGFTVRRIDDVSELAGYRELWNTLLDQNQTQTVELTYEWQICFWKHFNRNARLFVLIVAHQDQVIAIAPLKVTRVRKFGIPLRQLEFIAARESNYQDFIIGDHHAAVYDCIRDYLIQNHHLWDSFVANHVPEASMTVRFLSRQLQAVARHRLAAVERCIFAAVDKSWAAHIADLPKKSRAQISNRKNRLQKKGVVSTHWCGQGEELRQHIETFFDLHRKRWNPTNTPSQFNDARYCAFYREVSPQLMASGQIDLFALLVDDRAVALLYAFKRNRQNLIQLIAYDPDYADASPSTVMHELFMQDVFSGGAFDIVDFGNYHAYKELWANQFKHRLNIELYSRRPKAALALWLTHTEETIRKYLKSIEPLRRFVREAKYKLHFLKRKLINRTFS